MKQVKNTIIFIIVCLLICMADNLFAQNIKRDAAGNFTAIPKQKKEADKQSTFTFTDLKGNVYPVYISEKGKMYYIRTSKNGNDYKVYIK